LYWHIFHASRTRGYGNIEDFGRGRDLKLSTERYLISISIYLLINWKLLGEKVLLVRLLNSKKRHLTYLARFNDHDIFRGPVLGTLGYILCM
jgi:hypothetical protein